MPLALDTRPRTLTIGIDARATTEVTAGRGRFVRELLRALHERDDPHRYICYAREPWEEQLDDRFSWHIVPGPDPVWHLRAAIAASSTCDVYLSSNSYLSAPLLRIPCVTVVHDLLAFDREMGTPLSSQVVERISLPIAVRSTARFVCVSEATASALDARFPGARRRTTVAHLAARAPAGSPTAGELASMPDAGFVLSVGTLEPRKNLPRLASAYAGLPVELQLAHPLVVVGSPGWRHEDTTVSLAALGNRCRLLGSVSEGMLGELYRRCAVFCYPSLGEGFGLPVLEAMAAGAPVITSNVTSLPELGGDAVEYVAPAATRSIRDALERLLGSPARQAELRQLGLERAATFSWSRTAESVIDALTGAVRS